MRKMETQVFSPAMDRVEGVEKSVSGKKRNYLSQEILFLVSCCNWQIRHGWVIITELTKKYNQKYFSHSVICPKFLPFYICTFIKPFITRKAEN